MNQLSDESRAMAAELEKKKTEGESIKAQLASVTEQALAHSNKMQQVDCPLFIEICVTLPYNTFPYPQ